MDSTAKYLSAKLEKLKIYDSANENFRIFLDELFRDFVNQNAVDRLEFPSTFTKGMRAFIHAGCAKYGIKSKSQGKGNGRYITIFKQIRSSATESVTFNLSPKTANILCHVKSLNSFKAHDGFNQKRLKVQYDCIGKLFQGSMLGIPRVFGTRLESFRKSLPIYTKRDEILDSINKNKVILVNAETGSGKTTQIPQYIIEQAAECGQKVRVICTQPRRLSTIAVAERVAEERGEQIGQTVGYQIKLESKLGMSTALIYCTNGVLLRTLMSGDDCFKQVSHIIVDEIHERDKFTDFLLICLRECLKHQKHLRVILMSATMNMDMYLKYFNEVQVLHIEGRNYQCTSLFLEQVLTQIRYENKGMRELRELRERNGQSGRQPIGRVMRPKEGFAELDEDLRGEVCECLGKCFFNEYDEMELSNLMQLILNENVSPNFQDAEGRTALMAAAYLGDIQVVEQLLNMGADLYLTSNDGLTATGWAQRNAMQFANKRNFDVVNMLNFYQQGNLEDTLNTSEVSTLLSDYNRSMGDDTEHIDFDLILEIIRYIHFSMNKEGAILIFLPGYDDIMACNDKIWRSDMKNENFKVFMLHGSMQMRSQQQVFQHFHSMRKIILSTNIAETSITIDDVRFVIDSGKAKVKSYDTLTGASSLKCEWISMANSRQRAGRAGRTSEGYCFHLYSEARYESFYINPIPEILRVPLHELCLQTKILAPAEMPIKHFLDLAIEPPSSTAVETAIKTLLSLGALDCDENLTHLGQHLVQLSLEPHLGKMLIFASILRCIDPVLTVVSSMAHKEAFILPTQAHLKKDALARRKALSGNSLSDHLALIRAFQTWQEHKVQQKSNKFCNENYISHATMELIMVTRTQLLSQLRAMGFVQTSQKENIGELNCNSDCWPLVKACLACGLYPNVAYCNFEKLHTRFEPTVNVLTNSCIYDSDFNKGPDNRLLRQAWLVYDEINKYRRKATIKSATAINPLTVALLCGQNWIVENDSLIIDDCFELRFSNTHAICLRSNLLQMIDRKISSPHFSMTLEELENIKMLAKVLSSEDEYYNLPAPSNIGKRPQITHYMPTMEFNNRPNDRFRNDRRQNWRRREQNRAVTQYGGEPTTNGQFYAEPGPSTTFNNVAPSPQRELFPLTALYFIIKPPETKNIFIGIKKKSWNFAPPTEKKLFKFYNEGHVIYLIFNAKNNSNELHGVAQLLSTNNGFPNKPCALKWVTPNRISVQSVKSFIHHKIHLGEDGKQLDSDVGQKLCQFMYERGNYFKDTERSYDNFNRAPYYGDNSYNSRYYY